MKGDRADDPYSPPTAAVATQRSQPLGFRRRFIVATVVLAVLLPLALAILPGLSAEVSTLLLLAGLFSPAVWVLAPELRVGWRNVSVGRMAIVLVGLHVAALLLSIMLVGLIAVATWLIEASRLGAL